MPPSVKAAMRESQQEDGAIDPRRYLRLTRALLAEPFGTASNRDRQETFVWIEKTSDDVLQGDVYTDGSLIDNDPVFQGHCRSLGWAFVIPGSDGRVSAAAKGRPPGWVDTIYGAELWAVQMVVLHIFPGSARVITDCDSVRVGCDRGQKWTTAPGRVYARIWSVIHSTGDSGDLAPVVWMPAHTAEWQAGVTLKGDGSALTTQDRDANSLADRFAKAAATEHSVVGTTRAAIIEQSEGVVEMATWIAQVTIFGWEMVPS